MHKTRKSLFHKVHKILLGLDSWVGITMRSSASVAYKGSRGLYILLPVARLYGRQGSVHIFGYWLKYINNPQYVG